MTTLAKIFALHQASTRAPCIASIRAGFGLPNKAPPELDLASLTRLHQGWIMPPFKAPSGLDWTSIGPPRKAPLGLVYG